MSTSQRLVTENAENLIKIHQQRHALMCKYVHGMDISSEEKNRMFTALNAVSLDANSADSRLFLSFDDNNFFHALGANASQKLSTADLLGANFILRFTEMHNAYSFKNYATKGIFDYLKFYELCRFNASHVNVISAAIEFFSHYTIVDFEKEGREKLVDFWKDAKFSNTAELSLMMNVQFPYANFTPCKNYRDAVSFYRDNAYEGLLTTRELEDTMITSGILEDLHTK